MASADNIYDFRVSILPTVYGEDVVIRSFLNPSTFNTLEDLGISSTSLRLINQICDHKSGLILVTGPTGSGKTTTLYALLRQLQIQARGVIVTLEDPVENYLYGIRQSTIKPNKNYSYATGLKSILRQDPDIILVGEIRDAETAAIAIEAAYTGHLVLSSLHTNSVHSSLLRLKHFGCDPFLVHYALKGIISQKLENTQCNCMSFPCSLCHNTGVSSRQLNQEILVFNDDLFPDQHSIFSTKDISKLGVYKHWD